MTVPDYIHKHWYEPFFSQIIADFNAGRSRWTKEGIDLPDMRLSQFVSEQIIRLRVPISDIALSAGMKPDNLRNMIHEKRLLRRDEIRGLADALGCSGLMLRKMLDRDTPE